MANTRFMTQAPAKPVIFQKTTKTAALYKVLVDENISLKDRNKHLLLFLQDQIRDGKNETIGRILQTATDTTNLHLSFLKSMLIMTEHVPAVADRRRKLDDLLQKRMNAR